jgi:hypothetical protein
MPVTRPTRRKMYRTMQGRMVDIEKLRGANEQVPAVGNMRVNARGDILGPGGTILKPKEAVMKEYYETPKGRAHRHSKSETTTSTQSGSTTTDSTDESTGRAT